MSNGSIIFGLHAVEAALKQDADAIEQLWCDKQRRDKRLHGLLQLAARKGIKVQTLSRAELDKMAPGGKHQGVVAQLAQTTAATARNETFLEQLVTDLDVAPFLLVLDGVTDPHNLGACLRSADAAGVHAVIAPRDRACGLTPVVRKVASGAAETVPFVQVTNLSRTIKSLRDAGVWVIGTALEEGAVSLYERDLKGPLALVLGAEGKGIRRLTRENCDDLIYVPMAGSVQSLNVSVATGICLFEALRQRNS
ncbi:MAG: 23S rRNA (guanosine(2251)-2'-O)-methyltransferase RlmB [Pseudomonadota bacterium]